MDELSRATAHLRKALDVACAPETDLRQALGMLLAEQARALHGLGRCDEAMALLDEADERSARPQRRRIGHVSTTIAASSYRRWATLTRHSASSPSRSLAPRRAGLGTWRRRTRPRSERIAIAAGDLRQAQPLCERALATFRLLGD